MAVTKEIRVLYGDTDAYGVVWHGAYTKWFEAGRVDAIETLGFKLEDLEDGRVLFPVVEMNIRYKSPAKINDRIILTSKIVEVTPVRATFEHKVTDKETGAVRVIGNVTVVTTDPQTGKLYKHMPEHVYNAFKTASEQQLERQPQTCQK